MAINITSNPALKLAFGAASSTITFTTDAVAAIQTTATGSANGTNFTVASNVGLIRGDFLSVETGGLGGTAPWVIVIKDDVTSGALTVNAEFPALRATVASAVANRFERFETRYRASKVTLTNLTNGDVHVWDVSTGALDNTAVKNPATTNTPITANGILNRSNCIAIHPNLLPVSSSYTLKCDYDYYS